MLSNVAILQVQSMKVSIAREAKRLFVLVEQTKKEVLSMKECLVQRKTAKLFIDCDDISEDWDMCSEFTRYIITTIQHIVSHASVTTSTSSLRMTMIYKIQSNI
jgi:hypothetical protein